MIIIIIITTIRPIDTALRDIHLRQEKATNDTRDS